MWQLNIFFHVLYAGCHHIFCPWSGNVNFGPSAFLTLLHFAACRQPTPPLPPLSRICTLICLHTSLLFDNVPFVWNAKRIERKYHDSKDNWSFLVDFKPYRFKNVLKGLTLDTFMPGGPSSRSVTLFGINGDENVRQVYQEKAVDKNQASASN